MNEKQKARLLEEFAGYLEQTEADNINLQQQPDLFTLLGEMAGLKAEVKTESRYLKTMLERFSATLETLENDNKTLSAELARYPARMQQQRCEIQRKMLLDLLDVYDRLDAGINILEQYHPVNALFRHSKKQDVRFIKSLHQGQQMSIKRLQQLLQSYQVRAMETVGKILDPHTMTVVATVKKEKLPQGLVIEEMRKGFFFENNVLRLAEVKVNKK